MIHLQIKNLKQQTGAVLLVSMVILVALTMLGVTSMKGSMSELTMAGNLRESGLTFQAAEAGLRAAEAFVEGTASSDDFDGTTSLLNKASVDPNYLTANTWTSATEISIDLNNVKNKPKYILRYLGDQNSNAKAAIKIGSYGSGLPGKDISNFRVTSRSAGQTGNFYKVVQSYYAKEY